MTTTTTTMRFQFQFQFQSQFPFCSPPPPPQQQPHFRSKMQCSCNCMLTKQGHRFLTKLSTNNNNNDHLIRKFVKGSPKSVVLSTLTHLISPSTSHPHLSSPFALSLYTRITEEAPWFNWNPTILADLTALLQTQERYLEAQTLISEATSILNRKPDDLLLFHCKLLESHSKRASKPGFHAAYSYLNNLLHTSSSLRVKRRVYQYMVSGLCTMDMPRQAENLVTDFKQLQPSPFEFKSIIYAYGRLGFFEDLLRILHQMEEEGGFLIDTVCYNMLLSTHGIHGNHVEMVSLLTRMTSSGVPFSIRTYNSVSNSCPTIMNNMVELSDLPLSIEHLNARLEGGEAMVVRELLASSSILEEVMVWDSEEVKLDLHGFHPGSAYLVMLLWLEEMQRRLLSDSSNHGVGVPVQVTVVCGLGKHSSVRGESPVKILVKEMMIHMRSPLRIDRRKNNGCFVAKGKVVKNWLCDLRKTSFD